MSFKSVYKLDYTAHPIKKDESCKFPIRNPIRDPLAEYLKLDSYKEVLNPTEEYASNYIHGQFKEAQPVLAKELQDSPINLEEIERYKRNRNISVYNLDYSNLDKSYDKNKNIQRELHVDPANLPVTTYQKSFRKPTFLNPDAVKTKKMCNPGATLGNERKLLKMLNVTMGKTGYEDCYGDLGRAIMEDEVQEKILLPKCTCLFHSN